MATRGVKITGLNTLSNVSANTVLVSVDTTIDETLQTNVQALGNFILSQAGNLAGNINLGNVSKVHILGGSDGYVLSTDGLGNLNWVMSETIDGDGGNASSSILVLASLNGGNAASA